MRKYFNIAGPCNSNDHYMVSAIERNKNVLSLIEQGQYFVIYAARQTGKTTLVKSLVHHFNSQNDYYALYCSLESVQVFTEPNVGIPEALNNLKFAVNYSKLPHRQDFAKGLDKKDTSTLIRSALTDYCSELDRPLLLFIDEIDGLQNGTLITFLRQLRDGYVNRPEIPFPQSIALVGMRNIRDYKSKIRDGRLTLGSTSPFNVITKALTIKNFSPAEVENLYAQHTKETGQVFDKTAIEKVYDYTSGQPWLVNAIAREIVAEILDNDFSKNINAELVGQAAQNIMLRRDTHIDSLLERLKEESVRKVIEPIITGEKDAINITDDDTQYCLDLGIIKSEGNVLMPANKIYAEVIIRTLSYNTQYHLTGQIKNIWVQGDGTLDMNGLLKAFQQFWRENSEIWEEKYQYKEAAPHLILQAFLQRVVNSGGDISREYAGGAKRMDLCVRYGKNKYPVELKLDYGKKTIPDGLNQLGEYMDKLGEKTGWLVVFDRDRSKLGKKKYFGKQKRWAVKPSISSGDESCSAKLPLGSHPKKTVLYDSRKKPAGQPCRRLIPVSHREASTSTPHKPLSTTI
ncbi:MAG TPA: ATP-binding protein [Bacteroidetes bacterium]|nr:ATP-binding protein [Bacteroidota bacterium]